MSLTFVLGGARSGKSAYAERLAHETGRPKLYLATAESLDGEMAARIALHRARRGPDWRTLEAPIALCEALLAPENRHMIILVDCLTLWLSNLMCRALDTQRHVDALLEALERTQAQVILVSSEVGQGVVPESPATRQFVDLAGMAHQRIAAQADRVVWMAAGIPMQVKGTGR